MPKPVEMRVDPLLCPFAADVAQPGQKLPGGVELAGDAELRHYVVGRDGVDPNAPERPIGDIAVIDQLRDKPDRPHLAYQRGVEADFIDAIEDLYRAARQFFPAARTQLHDEDVAAIPTGLAINLDGLEQEWQTS